MGRKMDAYQWRLLFFKQCKSSWLLSKHYWCTIRSHCNKFWEESIELHYCFSRPFYGIDNTKSSSILNLTTFDECGVYFTFLTCMDVHHFILSYWAITTSISNYRHEVACCQVLWYICPMHTSYSTWKFPACVSCLVLLSNFNSLKIYGMYCSKNLTCFCGRVVSKIHSSTLILTCLWTSKRVLMKALFLECILAWWIHFVDRSYVFLFAKWYVFTINVRW